MRPVPITRPRAPAAAGAGGRHGTGWGTTANHGTAPSRRPRPERSLLYRAVQTHLATWLALAGAGDADPVPAHVEREFRRYLERGILAHG